jgi:ABC-2 type transport system permease protein
MNRVKKVIRFEYMGYVSTKSFRVVTILIAAIILVLCFIPQISAQIKQAGAFQGEKDKAVFLLGDAARADPVYGAYISRETLSAAVDDAEWTDGNGENYSETDLRGLVESGEYSFAVYCDGGLRYSFYAQGNKLSIYGAIPALNALVTEAARQTAITRLPLEVRADVAGISRMEAEVSLVAIGGNAENNFWVGYILMFFLFYVILGYGNYVSSSVVSEKSSKAMELLITAAKPLDLMIGKVVGVGLAALTQVAVIVAAFAAGIGVNLAHWKVYQPALFDLLAGSNISARLFVFLLLFFFFGFFLYAFMLAALASTVNRAEEAATIVTLPMMLLVASLVLGFVTLSGALNKTLVAVLSYIPFFTPFVMTSRFCIGDAGVLSAGVGVAVVAAAAVAVAWLAAKIYRMGVMMYGTPPTLRSIARMLRRA